MIYRTLGKTGLRVSALGFGASALGGAFGDVDETLAVQTVQTALDLGINYIDVAPLYGKTKAETILGKALKTIPRINYLLSTKVGRYDMKEFDFSPARVTASVDESLARLGSGHIDLLLVHDIEFGDLNYILNETLPALGKIRQSGKVRFLGVSGLPLTHLQYIADRTDLDAVISYCHYMLSDTTLADKLLPDLLSKNVGVINAACLGMGLFTDRGVSPWHPATEDIRHACAKAAALCRLKNADISKLALQFALSNPSIASNLVSAAQPDIVTRNIRCLTEPLDHDLLAKVQNLLKPIQNKTWPSGNPLPVQN